MSYFIIYNKDGKPSVKTTCRQCSFEIMTENPEYTEMMHDILAISGNIYDLNYRSLEKSLESKHPEISGVLKRVLHDNLCSETRCEAYDVDHVVKFIRYICMYHNINDFIIQEIRPNTIYHSDKHRQGCIHIANDYERVNRWDFNVIFVKYVLEHTTEIQTIHDFMIAAIVAEKLDVIDYLIEVGIDINDRLSFGEKYTNDEFGGYSSYGNLASEHGFQVLKHIVDRGCRHFNISSIYDPDELILLMPHINLEDMSFKDKCDMIKECLHISNLGALKMLAEHGLIITNDIMESMYGYHYENEQHTWNYCENLSLHVLNYMIDLGIEAKHFSRTYETAITNENFDVVEKIERTGIFKYFKPGDFLNAAAIDSISTMLEHLLSLDENIDQEKISCAYINSFRSIDCMKILEPYVTNMDSNLATATLNKYLGLNFSNENDKSAILFLMDRGAKVSKELLLYIVMSDLNFFETILLKYSEIDTSINVAKELSVYYPINVIQNMPQNLSLSHAAIFTSYGIDFERPLKIVLERDPNLDIDTLSLMFQTIIEHLVTNNDKSYNSVTENVVRKAHFLIEN